MSRSLASRSPLSPGGQSPELKPTPCGMFQRNQILSRTKVSSELRAAEDSPGSKCQFGEANLAGDLVNSVASRRRETQFSRLQSSLAAMQREEAKEAATKPMVHSISELKAESARALQFQIKLVNEQLLSPTLSPTEIDERVKLL
eukprot:CAMPEP_0170495254 /NCGR_PEP_ID=MMETSP0208-20121228/15103_1 /TAXON_ID=197538 /ORGANISM="Strombidium inclinatum, Strain S3" /LENGTH=144 /DNA_ID=CAMNT_0010771415 /DNA_START=224 /DNA_END=654 /DNA_ORIENTATION=-